VKTTLPPPVWHRWSSNFLCAAVLAWFLAEQWAMAGADVLDFSVMGAGAVLLAAVACRPASRRVRVNVAAVVLSGSCLGYPFLFSEGIGVSQAAAVLGGLVASLGCILWVLAALALNTSFSLLPAVRSIRTRGPYRWVRHPMYTAYLLMDLSIVILHPSLQNVGIALAGAALLAVRALQEENLLRSEASYQEYFVRTRYRMVPGFW
jgi:protein-S-isoprenylcysteine O-methyltransferase Ste14